MHASKHLTPWKHPADYGGFSPDGDYVILSVHRDSDCLDRSNWIRACEILGAEDYNAEHPHYGRTADDYPDRPNVYTFRAGHWAVGWVEYLLVRYDAPDSVLTEAREIVCSLADYPVLDESHYSDMEHDEMADYEGNPKE